MRRHLSVTDSSSVVHIVIHTLSFLSVCSFLYLSYMKVTLNWFICTLHILNRSLDKWKVPLLVFFVYNFVSSIFLVLLFDTILLVLATLFVEIFFAKYCFQIEFHNFRIFHLVSHFQNSYKSSKIDLKKQISRTLLRSKNKKLIKSVLFPSNKPKTSEKISKTITVIFLNLKFLRQNCIC